MQDSVPVIMWLQFYNAAESSYGAQYQMLPAFMWVTPSWLSWYEILIILAIRLAGMFGDLQPT